MENTFWHKQTADKPLFPDLLWSRPEVKTRAGKLLIIGGNKHGFLAPATAYGAAQKAGIGFARVLLPDVLQRTVGTSFVEAEFGSSTPSGSFARQTLALALELAKWADGVLLAGDFGRNSETAVLLEGFVEKSDGPLIITNDTVDYFIKQGSELLKRYNLVITSEVGKLQKMAVPVLIKSSDDLLQMVRQLGSWTKETKAHIITEHADHYIVASGGKVSITPTKTEPNWQVELSAYAATWLIQQPKKPFEALTTAAFCAVS